MAFTTSLRISLIYQAIQFLGEKCNKLKIQTWSILVLISNFISCTKIIFESPRNHHISISITPESGRHACNQATPWKIVRQREEDMAEPNLGRFGDFSHY
jgi:hypothetical protein